MHIPDGLLDGPTALATAGASAAVVAFAVRRAGREFGERTVPLLGVTAAFIFAAQMVNFPVAGGTSGHLLGGVLAAVLMGPWAAVIVMTVVVALQALAMADGGITALGANVLNMGVVGGVLAYAVFALLKWVAGAGRTRFLGAVALTAWLSIVGSAAAASLELAASGTVPLRVSLPVMTSVHMLIGLGEALITTVVVAAVLASRPDLVRTYRARPGRREGAGAAGAGTGLVLSGRVRLVSFLGAGLVLALALAVFVAPFASDRPDGLEFVAQEKGFGDSGAQPIWDLSPLAGYQLPGIENPGLATALAGLAGTAGLFTLVLLGGRGLARRSRANGLVQGPAAAAHPLGGHEHTDHRHAGHRHEHQHGASVRHDHDHGARP